MQINTALTSMEGFSAYHVQLQYFKNQTTCTKLQISHTRQITRVYSLPGSILSSFHAQGTQKYSHRKSSSFCVLWTVLASSLKETHTKPFSCTDFEVKFAQPVNLTGEKSFSCPYCEAKFSLSDSLKTHLHTHTEEKRFSCTYCEAKFALSWGLKQHLCIHTGEKPYSWTYCDCTPRATSVVCPVQIDPLQGWNCPVTVHININIWPWSTHSPVVTASFTSQT